MVFIKLETNTGKKIKERSIDCAMIPEVSNTAKSSPNVVFKNDVIMAKTSVLSVPLIKNGSEKN